MSALLDLKARATRSPGLTRRVFGVRVGPLEPGDRYFDLTTLALWRAARRRIGRGARVLDMGTGNSAVLALALERALGCRVLASDVDPRTVERARDNVARNGSALEVRRAALFEGLAGELDFVLFNPPYLPTATGRARAQPEAQRSMWDGGADGTDTIAAFLAAFEGFDTPATALLGVNRLHVPRRRVLPLVSARPGLALREVDARPLLPVDLYVLVRTKSPSTSTSMPLA